MKLAPIHIHPLLEIYALANKEDCHYVGSNTSTAMRGLITAGLIEVDPRVPPVGAKEPHGYAITRKGEAYIEAFLTTPMPIQIWRVPYERPSEE